MPILLRNKRINITAFPPEVNSVAIENKFFLITPSSMVLISRLHQTLVRICEWAVNYRETASWVSRPFLVRIAVFDPNQYCQMSCNSEFVLSGG